MAAKFTNANAILTTSRVKAYTAPVGIQSVVHGLFVSNVDTTNKLVHYVTIEYKDAGGTYNIIAKDIPVPYGNALIVDKTINLNATEELYLTADASSSLQAFFSILEKS